MQKRGQLTDNIKSVSSKLMGYEISIIELRLMPYLQYLVVNQMNIDPAKISSDERKILSNWREKGYISGGASELNISKEFWDIISEIIYVGYVDLYD